MVFTYVNRWRCYPWEKDVLWFRCAIFFTVRLVPIALELKTRIQRQQKNDKKKKGKKEYRREERTELTFTNFARSAHSPRVFLYGKSGSACLLHTRKWVKWDYLPTVPRVFRLPASTVRGLHLGSIPWLPNSLARSLAWLNKVDYLYGILSNMISWRYNGDVLSRERSTFYVVDKIHR